MFTHRSRELNTPEPAATGEGVPFSLGLVAALPSVQNLRDNFLERRYTEHCGIYVRGLVEQGLLRFFSQGTQVDRYLQIDSSPAGLLPGIYRIRDQGGQLAITRKPLAHEAAGLSLSAEQLDLSAKQIDVLSKSGKLVAVVEKDRTTYRFELAPDCLLHVDRVRGLGSYVDLKADSQETMERFLMQLRPDPDTRVPQNYLELKQRRGISPFQLRAWRLHENIKEYMSGVVSGTLTPLGFLSATLASTPSKSALVVALLSAGVSDGLSDVAAGAQANQSESRVSPLSQTSIFMKTLAAKCLIPCSFIPVVLALESNVAIAAVTAGIAAVLLASTATVQALARERPVLPAVAKLLGWGAAVSLVGTGIGAAVPEVFRAATRG